MAWGGGRGRSAGVRLLGFLEEQLCRTQLPLRPHPANAPSPGLVPLPHTGPPRRLGRPVGEEPEGISRVPDVPRPHGAGTGYATGHLFLPLHRVTWHPYFPSRRTTEAEFSSVVGGAAGSPRQVGGDWPMTAEATCLPSGQGDWYVGEGGGANVLGRFQIHQQERAVGQVARLQEIKGTVKTQASPTSAGSGPAPGDRHTPPPPSCSGSCPSGLCSCQAWQWAPSIRRSPSDCPTQGVTAAAA